MRPFTRSSGRDNSDQLGFVCELVVSHTADCGACRRSNQGPGQHDLLHILDVNGQTFVIHATYRRR